MTKGARILLVTAERRDFDPGAEVRDPVSPDVVVARASTREEARRILATGAPLDLVFTEEKLPDGDWRDVHQDVKQGDLHAKFVVRVGPEASLELWLEALDRGARVLQADPHETVQLQRLAQMAQSTHPHPPGRGALEQ